MVAIAQGGTPAVFDLAAVVGAYAASAPYMPVQEVTAWLTRLLSWHNAWGGRAALIASELLEALVAVGVYGTGTGFGHDLLVPLAPGSVLVPGVGPVRVATRPGGNLGAEDSSVFVGAIFGPAVQGEEVLSFAEAIVLPPLDQGLTGELAGIISQARTGIVLRDLTECWQKRLVVLTCAFDAGAGLWRMNVAQASALLSWAGIAPDVSAGDATDPDQAMVIALPATQRAIVTAGPGSGKTHVVCQRVAHLLDSGVSASRTWLLSFTRVAVEELRDRIAAGISRPDEARALNVATFDSFAGRLLHATLPQGAQRPSGHDATVRAALQIMRDPPPAVNGFVAGLAHVVIDEAQDLLGERLALMCAFLALLPPDCGVTILGDPAQSIYRFSLGSSGPDATDSLLDPRPGFAALTLGTDHRTRDPELTAFFAEARHVLGDAEHNGAEARADMRRRIEQFATPAPRGAVDPVLPPGRNSMVLFRGRRALLAESHRLMARDIAFRLRPSGQGDLVLPWIGALLAGLPGRVLVGLDDIAGRVDQMQALFADSRPDQLWTELNHLADSPSSQLDTARLQRRLGQSLPPRYLRRFLGHAGPLLGTIHGAKGLEADNVLLMLPYMPSDGPDDTASGTAVSAPQNAFQDAFEETRVLYVGATRARVRLYIGRQRPGRMQSLSTGRFWRGYPGNFSLEIGIEGDVLPVLTDADPEARATALRVAAEALAATGPSPKAQPGVALRDEKTGAWVIFRADPMGFSTGPPLGQFSADAIEAMAKIAGCDQVVLPNRIGGFFLSGAATCTWTVGDDSGIALMPVLCGLASISLENSF